MISLLRRGFKSHRFRHREASGIPVFSGDRHGESPRRVEAAEAGIVLAVGELISHLRNAHPDDLIGVVATTARSAALETALCARSATFLPAPDARGLEFDTVIIIDPDDLRSTGEAGLRDLYVAQTRATKRLVTLTITQ